MPDSSRDVEANEIAPQVHEELSLLPERYRAPLILCYLQGLTHEQAAQQLGCPLGTVRSRLARGREQLRSRLIRRGLASSMSSIGIGFMKPIVPALVPPAWVENTVGAAVSLEAGGCVSIVVSASVLRLVKGVLTTMFLTKLKALGASFLIVSIVGLSAGGMARQDPPRPKGLFSTEGATPKFPDTEVKRSLDWLGMENSPWNVHRIVAPPGARVQIRVETSDKNITNCEAVVGDDGLLRMREDFADLKGKVLTESQLTGQSIVISSQTSREQSATTEKPQGLFGRREAMKPGSARTVEATNHESRLRDLEQKLERVLDQLESKTSGKRRSPFDAPPK
jgi:hypothetical protein